MKTTSLLFILFYFALSSAQAEIRVYKTTSNKSFSEILKNYAHAITDQIPQLGIIVGDSDALDAAGLIDYGPVKIIRLSPVTNTAPPPKDLWGVKAIKAEQFWPIAQGQGVVVAVSDTGVDFRHPSLAPNAWVNPGEIPGNGIDDDNNGFIDDVHGWDFVRKKPAMMDNHYHGTHVAGTIAAIHDGKIVGVAPQAKIMSVPFLNAKGSGTDVDGAKTLVYAVNNGAKIVNCSWGGAGGSAVLEDAIKYMHSRGALMIAAAGNDSKNIESGTFAPAGLPDDNIVAIASSEKSGSKSSFSNYGKTKVDFAAPGSNILSAAPTSGKARYQYLSGTSMATPHVSGLAALILSARPYLNSMQLKDILMRSAAPSNSWKGKTVTGGIADASLAAQNL